MKNDGIGKLIFELRKQEQITEKELSQGLCSLAEFRKIEAGERKVEKTLLDALLGRMGRAADNFFIILEKEQYQLYELRNQIQEAYLIGDNKKLQEKMEKLKEKNLNRSRCDKQFYYKMKFLMGEYLYNGLDEMEEVLVGIIQITIPQFKIEKVSGYYLCLEEISLCCLLASMYQQYKERRKAKILLENLIACIDRRYQDTEEKVQIYPQVILLLLQVYDVKIENEKWITFCQKTIDLLAENGILTLMDELLECYKVGLEEKIAKGQRQFTKLEELVYQNVSMGLKSIQELKQEYQIDYGKREFFVIKQEYNEVFLLQEMILDYRKRVKKSQNQLSQKIGIEPETISRYESGKRKPSDKIYQILVEEIGIPKEKYGVILPVEDYTLYKKIRKVERYLLRREFLAAQQLFLEIEPLIPKEKAENQQYCIRTQTILDFYLHGLKEQEKLKRLEQAMRLTIPKYNALEENFLKYHIPSRYETTLLNNIAASYIKLGQNKQAIIILKAILKVYQESEIKEEYHLSAITLTEVSYSKCIGNMGNYKEALDEIEKTLRMNLQFGKGNMIPYLIYEKGWNIWKNNEDSLSKEKRNACMKCYQQAYWISGFMNNFVLQQKIEYLYKKDFKKKLV